jgi:hypothetical protein
VAVRDDGGGERAIALLGHQCYPNVRVVMNMGRRVQRCRSRRAAVMESTTTTRMADNTTREEGQTTTTRDESGCSTMQGDNNGRDDGSGDVTLRTSYSQRQLLRV